ncbi:MAG TPA: L-seryl-tRNA(Sec) selenium transferase [Acidisarcina sp.]
MKTSENKASEVVPVQPDAGSLYRSLPSLDELLRGSSFEGLLSAEPRGLVIRAARFVLFEMKREIAAGRHTDATLNARIVALSDAVACEIARGSRYSLQRVINATGVVLHTNLGRAPLGASALAHVVEVASGYCNLEFDLETGERNRRDVHAEGLLLSLLRDVSGANQSVSNNTFANAPWAAVVVNNCAAATFLALNSIADGGEVIVSRGELIEIGGGFRIPEILAKSGAVMREVGTTNRTRLSDFESAITPETKLILRVHQSNFSMEGFIERPTLEELVSLGERRNIPVFDDQGTGLMQSLRPLDIYSEPTLLESFCAGPGLIAASGDKLFGGPQCGLLIGTAALIERVRRNPLYRTYRVDKLAYAALEATLMDHRSGRDTPVSRMINAAPVEIFKRCEEMANRVNCADLCAEAVPVPSLIGGGAAPSARLQSTAVSLGHATLAPQDLLSALRRLDPPVVGRVSGERVLLDLRTVEPEFDATLISLLQQAAQIGKPDLVIPHVETGVTTPGTGH